MHPFQTLQNSGSGTGSTVLPVSEVQRTQGNISLCIRVFLATVSWLVGKTCAESNCRATWCSYVDRKWIGGVNYFHLIQSTLATRAKDIFFYTEEEIESPVTR